MSQISEKSPQHCAQKQALNHHKFKKSLFFYISAFFLTILSLIFLVWLMLHPKTPRFTLQQAQIYQLNVTGPSSLNSSIHITILSHNPNRKAGIYYDEFLLHASYADQQITRETSVSPFYQDHDETNVLSALLIGNQQPMDPSLIDQVRHDKEAGKVGLNLKGFGRLRWKVGMWVSGRYRFTLNCTTIVPFGNSSNFGHDGAECWTTV